MKWYRFTWSERYAAIYFGNIFLRNTEGLFTLFLSVYQKLYFLKSILKVYINEFVNEITIFCVVKVGRFFCK